MRTAIPGSFVAVVGCAAVMMLLAACGDDSSPTSAAGGGAPSSTIADDWPPLPPAPAGQPAPAITVQLRPASAEHGATPMVGTFDVRRVFSARVPAEHLTWPRIERADGELLPDGLYILATTASLEASIERGLVLKPGETFHSQQHIARLSSAAPASTRVRMEVGTRDQTGARKTFVSEPVELRFGSEPRLFGVDDLAADWPVKSMLSYWHTTPGNPGNPRTPFRTTGLEIWADGTAVAQEQTFAGPDGPGTRRQKRLLTPEERSELLQALRVVVGQARASDEPMERSGAKGGIRLFLASGDAVGLYELPDQDVDADSDWSALRALAARLVESITDE